MQATVPLRARLPSPFTGAWARVGAGLELLMLGRGTRPGTTGAPSPSGPAEEREWQRGGEERRFALKTHGSAAGGAPQSRLVCVSLSECQPLHPAVVSLICSGPWTVWGESLPPFPTPGLNIGLDRTTLQNGGVARENLLQCPRAVKWRRPAR